MKKYEIGLVISPDLEEEALNEFLDKVEQWVKAGDGQILKIDRWGKRRLAYTIGKFREGNYVFYTIETEARSIRPLEQNFNISEIVLRYLTIKLDE